MGKVLDAITDKEAKFIANSKVFFVATAPVGGDDTTDGHGHGHVNVSPKAPGHSCIVLSERSVAYADLTGSGAETAAHLLQNSNNNGGRMTLMFCNLQSGPPQILRLFGRATVLLPQDCPAEWLARFPVTNNVGFRAVYHLQVERISSSCGYSLPQMDFVKYRKTLDQAMAQKGADGVREYRLEKNSFSIDGLPSLGLLQSRSSSSDSDNENGENGVTSSNFTPSYKFRQDIQPVATNGYIYGEKKIAVVDATHGDECPSDATTTNLAAAVRKDALEQARRMHQQRAVEMQSKNGIVGGGDLVSQQPRALQKNQKLMDGQWLTPLQLIVLVAVFAAGVAVGQMHPPNTIVM